MNRTRTRSHDPMALTCRYGVNAPSPSDAGSIIRNPFEVMHDRTNPGYFKAAREGKLLPVAPMDKVYETYVISPTKVQLSGSRPQPPWPDEKYTLAFEGLGFAGSPPTFAPVPEYDLDILVQEAKGRAQARAFDALTFIAELRKSIEMIVGLRARAVSLYERFIQRVARAVRRKKPGEVFDIAKLVSEIWLEMRYGWRPLVYEMFAIQEALERPFLDPDKVYRGYASKVLDSSSSTEEVTSGVSLPAFTASNLPFNWRTVTTRSTEVEYRGAVGVSLGWQSNLQLDPFITAWELIPHTVFLGWFVNIADVLRAWSPFCEANGRFSTGSVTITQTSQRVSVPFVTPGWTSTGFVTPGTDLATRISYVRTPLQPTPTFAFRVDLSIAKIIDLIAVYGLGNLRLFRKLASVTN